MAYLTFAAIATFLVTSSFAYSVQDVTTAPPEDPDCLGDERYWPDIYDCAKYFACNAQNIKVEMKCAEGTLWNQLLKTCDNPQNVDCSWTVTSTEGSTVPPTEMSTTQSPTIEPTPTSEPATGTTGNPPTVDPSFLCDTELEYFPDPYDCRGFYQCLHGVKEREECPEPLMWDVRITGCSISSDCSQVVSTTTSTTPDGTTTPKPHVCENGDLTGDSLDCHRFFYCQNNKWTGPLQCPADLYWSQTKKGCVVLAESDCDHA